MNYANEYDTGSAGDGRQLQTIEELAARMEILCGRGSVLEVGAPDGSCARALARRGIKSQGAVPHAENQTLPVGEASFDSIVSIGWLSTLGDAEVQRVIAEFLRVARRFVFVTVSSNPVKGAEGFTRDRAWWEHSFFAAGFRKHPLSQLA